MRRGIPSALLAFALALAVPDAGRTAAIKWPAPAAGAQVAALQTALWARGIYHGDVSGIMTPATLRAVKRLQRRAGLVPDGVVGPLTRPLLGRLRGPALGSRTLRKGLVGADVAELQFLLAEHGFPCARFDGRMGAHTVAALRRFQGFAGLPVTGRAAGLTLAALGKPPPEATAGVLEWPLHARISSGFGPRGDAFHPGIDLAAASGTPVGAAAAGTVVFAGPGANYGLLIEIEHAGGLATLYAHLSRIDVVVGQQVEAGHEIGLVGATGEATGPHLHFELRVRGAAIDPLPALG